MSPRPSIPLTHEYILLGLLHQQPMHGYDLHKEITSREGIAVIWTVKQSQLYALLDKLETQGLLTSTLVPRRGAPFAQGIPADRGRPAGFRRLDTKSGAPPAPDAPGFPGAPVLRHPDQPGGSRSSDPPATGDLPRVAAGLAGTSAEMREDQYFERSVYDFRATQITGMLAWLSSLEKKLTQKQPAP